MESFLNKVLFTIGSMKITPFSVIAIIATIIVARLIIRLVENLLVRFFNKKEVDSGRQVAFIQILKYLVYLFAFLIILKSLGIGITALMFGSGALLVGIGFGLQQTFNDFVSGVILLFEGGVSVGDDLDVNGLFGHVTRIGMRTTEVLTRDDVKIIIPNSILVSNSVTNWTHNKRPARFHVDVGVSYEEDITEVERLLLECANVQYAIWKSPSPSVQLIGFGESSVDFKLYFYSREFILIEKIKSDLRKRIFKKFNEHNISIPFPQRDLNIYRSMDIRSLENLDTESD